MALLIDTPRWPAHGRLWAHLVSDTSLAELHTFAAGVGIPTRSFEGDHYDVPAERHADVLAAGAALVEGRAVVQALQRSGLRLPKRKGERVLATWPQAAWPDGFAGHTVDCVASALVPVGQRLGAWLLVMDDEGRLALDGDRLPTASGAEPRVGYLRVRGRQWHHVGVHHVGLRDGAAVSTRGHRWVPLDRVEGVEAQEHWWPLLRLVSTPRTAG